MSLFASNLRAAMLDGIHEETAAGHVSLLYVTAAILRNLSARFAYKQGKMLKEIRQAFRMLVKNPGFTAIAALSLALGIGANSAIFSLADALLLRPLPVPQPGGVMTITNNTLDNPFGGTSFPDYRDFRERSQSFDGLAAYRFYTFGFAPSASEQPQMRMGFQVSDNFFRVLRVQPALGRAFLPEEGRVSGRDPVAILSHDMWEKQFASDPAILGRTIRLNGIDFSVIGVTPASFTGLDALIRPSLYVPLGMLQRLAALPKDPLEDRSIHGLQVKARLKPGVSREQAQAELIGLAKNLEKSYPDTNRNRNAAVRTELQARVERDPWDAALAAMMMGLVGLVLLIACANVANLMLARARARSREIAIRLAIGAGRLRLVRQLLIESLLLALIGGGLGVGVGYLGILFLDTLPIPSDLPVAMDAQLDQRVLLFSLLAAIASALVFGIAPAWQASKTDLIPALKSAGLTSSARRRTIGRNILVIGQVALSLVLLVASAMVLDGFRKTLVLDPGFRTDHVMMMELDTSFARYADDRSREFYRNLKDRVRALPGVQNVALAQVIPMMPAQPMGSMVPEGYQFPKGQDTITVGSQPVDENYFETMKIPILRGRAFTAMDKADSRRVAIVNEAFAEKYWPHQEAVAKRLRLKNAGGPMAEVVGVAKTGRYLFISEPPQPYVYIPYAQSPSYQMTILAKTQGDPADLAAPMGQVVRSLDANLPVYNTRTLSSFYQQRAIGLVKYILELVVGMGALGLALALVGLYGLISYSVSRRTQEIGIRMAMGAKRPDVLRLVLRQGFVLSVIGVAIGFLASLGLRPILNQALLGLGTPSPVILVIVPALLILVTMAACYVPARRASQVDPIRALRYE
ncbi:MAG TPA: ABC transporter permease [Bryobacteraceae bacterium]|nr:ABC transporter permease [Bryobacteraceae bacterium]